MELFKTHKALFATFVLTILYALHYGIPLYATSSFLKSLGFTSAGVNLLYGVSALLTVVIANHISQYVRRYHTYGFTYAVVAAEIAVTIGFALTTHLWLSALFFVAHFILTVILFVLLNIFVESFTPIKQTGLVRGVFLTLLNTGILVAPLIGGLVLSSQEAGGDAAPYASLYIIASLVLVPYFFFLHHYLKETTEPPYETHSLVEAMRRVYKNKDLFAALLSQCALYAFYTVMIIYAAPHVTSMLSISLSVYLTSIAPLALLPLVILPYELGYLADTKFGEKELMALGLIILGATSIILGVLETSSFLIVVSLLILSRIGAACVETMSYSYYYKKIPRNDPALSAVFTNMNAVATCVVPRFLFTIAPLITLYKGLPFILVGLLAFSVLHSVSIMHNTK